MDNSYKAIITSEHRDKPKYMKTVSVLLDKLQDFYNAGESLISDFDIDNAQGKQLDLIGFKIGASRTVSVSPTEAYNLEDVDYRVYLKSKIAKNNWTGGIEDLQNLWVNLFGDRIIIVDNQDMSIDIYILGTMSPTMINLLRANVIVPKPTSVLVNIHYYGKGKIFSYGFENDLYTGYGGWWQSQNDITTSFAYDKIKTEEDPVLGGYDVGFWSTEV